MLRATLLKLSESRGFAHWVTSNPTTRRMARRFVPGETLDDAIIAARACNSQGMYPSLDFCEGLLLSIVERAAGYENFLRVDMENSVYTQRTIDLVKHVRARNPAVGTVIQSYLYRSEGDVQDLLTYGCRIRLCKGAYKESDEVAYARKKDVDGNYVRLMQMLLPSGFYHAIATHDPRMIAQTIRFAAAKQISKDDFEFQMLYGVRTDLQRQLVKDGYRLRIYIPFGKDWFPYFMRRLAELPANLAFFARNFLRP